MLIEDVLNEFKRTHLEHIEDLVITNGFEGGKSVVEYFKGLLVTLQGTSSEAVSVSVKWDGAPAVVCGTNPDNGKFFVGTILAMLIWVAVCTPLSYFLVIF